MDGESLMEIEEYYTDFMQDIYARSGSGQDFYESVYTERMCDFLVDQAVIEDYTYIGYKKSGRNVRADAWVYDDDAEVLNLFVIDFAYGDSVRTVFFHNYVQPLT